MYDHNWQYLLRNLSNLTNLKVLSQLGLDCKFYIRASATSVPENDTRFLLTGSTDENSS